MFLKELLDSKHLFSGLTDVACVSGFACGPTKNQGILKGESCNRVDNIFFVFFLCNFWVSVKREADKERETLQKSLAKLFLHSEAERITNHSYKALSQQAHSLSQYLFWVCANGDGSHIARAHHYWTHSGLWVDETLMYILMESYG